MFSIIPLPCARMTEYDPLHRFEHAEHVDAQIHDGTVCSDIYFFNGSAQSLTGVVDA